MKTPIVFLLLLGVSSMIAFEVVGTIINRTGKTLILTESEVQGEVKFLPLSPLPPETTTNFTLETSYGLVSYDFGFTAEDVEWCSQHVDSHFSFSFGFGSSCIGQSVSCGGGLYLEMYEPVNDDCSDSNWFVTDPTFVITTTTLDWGSK